MWEQTMELLRQSFEGCSRYGFLVSQQKLYNAPHHCGGCYVNISLLSQNGISIFYPWTQALICITFLSIRHSFCSCFNLVHSWLKV
jgi:hypothetical protein